MNRILLLQRKWLTIALFLEAIGLGTLIVLYYYVPDFPYYFITLTALTSFFIAFDFISVFVFNLILTKKKGKSELRAAEIIGNDISEAYQFGEIGLVVCDHDDNIVWVNDFLGNRFKDIVDTDIKKSFPETYQFSDPKKQVDSIRVTSENHIYRVEYLKEAHLYIFKDISKYEALVDAKKNEAPVIGYLCIDNYSDVQLNISDETRFTDMLTDVRKLISNFAAKYHCFIRRIKDDRYLFITTMKQFDQMQLDKFSIIDDVRKEYQNGFTISIGVAYGFPDDYPKNAELASNALDVALSRGGDQAVIQPFDSQLIFIGGKTELQPSRNRVKLRTNSTAFTKILCNYKNVIIMPHDNADFDAIGSALGLYLVCRSFNIPARICWEEQHIESHVRIAVESEYTKEEMDEIFVNMKNVDAEIHGKETLLLCTDHNDPGLSIFKDLFNKCHEVVVIDHHRPNARTIENTRWDYIDTSASSASEIVTMFITFNEKKINIDERTATFLFAGICLDTRFFKEHATTNTFDASAQLKNARANALKVSDYLKDDFENYRQKVSILNRAVMPHYGVLVAVSPDNDKVDDAMLAIVANEAMNIRGVYCSFCIGRISPTKVKISARSDSTVSVQLLMEKLGGGGHLAAAACVKENMTVDELNTALLKVLDDYLEDAKLNPEDEKKGE